MSDQQYSVILEGTVKPGLDKTVVVQNLARVLKKDAGKVAGLLTGKPRVIRKDLDLRTASKYRVILERAGASARVARQKTSAQPAAGLEAPVPKPAEKPAVHPATKSEDPSPGPLSAEVPDGAPPEPLRRPPVTPPATPAGESALRPHAAPTQPEEGAVCPKCGYQPTRADDVMLVRGDCPLCGFLVTRFDDIEGPLGTAAEEEIVDRDDIEGTYAGMDPASWERRACATLYTLALCVAVFSFIDLIIICLVLPLHEIPANLATRFLRVAFESVPWMMTGISILCTSFAWPMVAAGRTFGQEQWDIGVYFTEEGQWGGLIVSVTFRTAAVFLLTYAPGLMVLDLASRFGVTFSYGWDSPIMGGTALVGWGMTWLWNLTRKDKRSFLDHAGGVVQTEHGLMPHRAVMKALRPLLWMLSFLLFLGVAVPYIARMLGR